MQLSDMLAIVLAVASGAAFLVGEAALARAEDVHAIYWLTVGAISLHAAVQLARPGAAT
jgi:hypothetical protein